MAQVLGIDEAGRGAVLGPLVVAGVLVPEEELPLLVDLGAKDSKAVPRDRRRGLVRGIARRFPVRAVVIPAREVDSHTLTELELTAAAELIASLSPDRVVLDAPVAPAAIPAFLSELSQRSGHSVAFLSAYPKADRTHPAAAAASLAAKVIRDAYVLFLRRRYGDFGWGYPGEDKVVAFLKDWLASHGSLPPICRTRWRSVGRLLQEELFL